MAQQRNFFTFPFLAHSLVLGASLSLHFSPSSVSPPIQPSHFEVQVPGTASRSDRELHLKDSILQSDVSAQKRSQPPSTR